MSSSEQVREFILVGIAAGSVPDRQRRRVHEYIPTDNGSYGIYPEWYSGSGGL